MISNGHNRIMGIKAHPRRFFHLWFDTAELHGFQHIGRYPCGTSSSWTASGAVMRVGCCLERWHCRFVSRRNIWCVERETAKKKYQLPWCTGLHSIDCLSRGWTTFIRRKRSIAKPHGNERKPEPRKRKKYPLKIPDTLQIPHTRPMSQSLFGYWYIYVL